MENTGETKKSEEDNQGDERQQQNSPTESQKTVSDDDEIDYSVEPEFYDPELDDKDELWVKKRRKGPNSDAVLTCPACFTTLCLDCQRHEKYLTQYRAMFVVNCKIIHEQASQPGNKRKRGRKQRNSAEAAAESSTGEIVKPVQCAVCSTQVGVLDEEEGIRCISMEQGLKPRPKHNTSPLPKPLENEQVVVGKEYRTVVGDVDFSSGICGKIEKMVSHGLFRDALELFEILECKSGESNVGISTYDALIRACIGLKSGRGVKRVMNYMHICGVKPDQYLSNRLLLMHVKCGMMMDALRLFDDLPERNVVSWNTIIGGLLDSGDYHGAFGMFLMMSDEYISPDSRMLAMMIRASAGVGLIAPGRQLHSLVVKMDVEDDIYVSCSLIDMYSKCGSIDDARENFFFHTIKFCVMKAAV
ncbi:OLC1v1033257C1 [Oldenlandia corymbosa var. corymbosa]|uniref:OLC1v1033257C1 n=1 Tax=Oldenlandia corymbosa var. corymbosa TaxID=529605 RepID=A0AAV1CP85_OLDCO|nr:OLC1v1033257C1 [Oldenlandia corymbosa var. corymbosa]